MQIYNDNLEGTFDSIIVPFIKKEDFYSALELGLVNCKYSYILNFNVTCEESLKFIKSIIYTKLRSDDTHNIFNELDKCLINYNFNDATSFVKYLEGSSSTQVSRQFYESLLEVLKTIEFFKNSILISSPIAHNTNWIDSVLSAEQILQDSFKEGAYLNCPVKKVVIDNYKVLVGLFSEYTESRNFMRLSFLSAYFFFYSEIELKAGDISKSTLLLHRSLETSFLSLLLEEGEISIDKDGEVIGDSYLYLKDYFDKTLPFKSYTQEEMEAVSTINSMRNKGKFAHGYTIGCKVEFTKVFDIIKTILIESDDLKRYYLELCKIISISKSPNSLAYTFLIDGAYVERKENF